MKAEISKFAHKTAFLVAFLLGLLILTSIGAPQGIAKEISGYIRTPSDIAINGVNVTFEKIGSTTTNEEGYYSRGIPNGWSGTVTPAKDGYSFDPASRNYSNVTSNLANQDYTGSLIQVTRTISGYVRTGSGTGISGVTVTFDNAGSAATSDSGYYSRSVPNNWSGTVTPAKDGYTFDPASRNYSNVTSNLVSQDYAGIEESERLSLTINIIGSGNVELDPEKEFYSVGSPITLTGIPQSGWVFGNWSGDLNSPKNPESISIRSDIIITAIFLEDFDNDGVSDEEENSGPNGGDGNNDGILDSLQSNVSFLVLDNTTDYVALEAPLGTSIKNCNSVADPPNSNYPSDVDFLYGFFTFTVEGINIGGPTSVIFYFPTGFSFNTYSKYGPTPDETTDHWYEFIFDGLTGAKINGNSITLHFVDGKRGDDDLTENGIISDIGGPGIRTAIPHENDANPYSGGEDSYGCFVECLL